MTEPGGERELLLALREVMLAHDHLRMVSAEALLGMGSSEMLVLSRLALEGATTPSELAGQLRLTSQALTALVDRLVNENLARRTPHPRDRRKILVELTEIGARAMEQFLGRLDEVLERSAAHLGERERAAVLGFLRDTASGLAEVPGPALPEIVAEADAGARLVLRLSGELDIDGIARLRDELRELVVGSVGDVVIDVTGLTYLPSAGVRLLGDCVTWRPARVRLRAAPDSHSARVLELVGFDHDTTP